MDSTVPRRREVSPPGSKLGPYARQVLRFTTPWIILPWLLAAVALRVWQGQWTWRDPAIVAVVVLLQPFTEWVIHVTVLHFRPRTVRGRNIDLHLAKEHRAHHRNPRDVGLTLIPRPELVALVVGVSVGAWFLAIDHRDALTVMAAVAAVVAVYEWTHYLIHSTYRPRSKHYRSIWRAHRLHHFRNEHYWMGITSNAADRVLGTYPEKGEVELSPTASTLVGLAEAQAPSSGQ